MWLSNVPMQHSTFSGRPNWNDNYWVHTRVMQLFGDLSSAALARRNGDILYRVEPGIGLGRVLVQSSVRPLAPEISTVDTSGILNALDDGASLQFHIKLNSTKTANRTSEGITTRTRVVIPEDELAEWVISKLSPGLSSLDIETLDPSVERQRKTPIAVVVVSGKAVVVDSAALTDMIKHGVGKARAFGCGLLSVIPT